MKTLEFVDKINADIKTYTFEISFKPNSNVDFHQIRMKVEKAGFSVSSFVATISLSNVPVKNNKPTVIGDKTFLFVNAKEQLLNGQKQFKVLDKGFVSQKESKVHAFSALSAQTFHVTI